MRDVVHVRLHKTGSSWLKRHVFPLAEGITPLVGGDLVQALMRNLVGAEGFAPAALRGLLAEEPGVLLSYEGLVGSPWRGIGAPTDVIADRLQDLLPDATILVILRREEELIGSLYRQYVNEGGARGPRHFRRRVLRADYTDVDALRSRFAARFPDVVEVDYRDLREDPHALLDQLSTRLDVRFPTPVGGSQANVSLSGWRLALLRAWNAGVRRSHFNPDPPLPIPHTGAMRYLLQGDRRDR